jgi:hypothetical protein
VALIGAALISAAFIMWPFFCGPNGMEAVQIPNGSLEGIKRQLLAGEGEIVVPISEVLTFLSGQAFGLITSIPTTFPG